MPYVWTTRCLFLSPHRNHSRHRSTLCSFPIPWEWSTSGLKNNNKIGTLLTLDITVARVCHSYLHISSCQAGTAAELACSWKEDKYSSHWVFFSGQLAPSVLDFVYELGRSDDATRPQQQHSRGTFLWFSLSTESCHWVSEWACRV